MPGQLALDVRGAPSEAPVGSPTREAEDYWTPPDLARAIVARLPIRNVVVLEPHVGGGSFTRALREGGAHAVYGCDIADVPDPPAHFSRQDFLDPLPADWPAPEVVVGNPPFSSWEAHARRALDVVRPGGLVCFILPVSVVQLGKHQPFLDEHPIVYELRILGRPWTVVRECSAFMWRRRRPDSRVIDTDWRCERLGWRR